MLAAARGLTSVAGRGFLRPVESWFSRTILAVAVSGAVLCTSLPARAQAAPNSDQLQGQIAELEKAPNSAAVIKQPLDSARRSIARARDARAAGDVQHGIELDALAADYVAIARALLRAVALEAQLKAAQSRQVELEDALRQTETMLEATIAQRERTRAALEQITAAREAEKRAPAKTETPRAAKKNKSARAK